MEGAVARWYDRNTRRSLPEFRQLAERLAALVSPHSRFLEVAPGPGFLAIELARRGFPVTGLDISQTFVGIARENARREGVAVDFRLGNAAAMPFENDSFDFLVCRAAFKNFSEPVGALQEMHRVLRPGGQALIIDLRRDVPMRTISHHVDGMGMTALSRWFTKLTFRFMLLKRAYTRAELEKMLAQTPFATKEIRQADVGFEAWLVK
ncbi:MAG TPA: methyltransferase domain-containing protein [Bryobacteraceae bacterium]|nr:methyltransferase domain-containing protein [Bryobacteraceae bacterium]